MLELFAGVHIGFLLAGLALFFVMSILSEFGKTGWETIIVVAVIVAMNFFGPWDTLAWVKSSTAEFITSAATWIGIGIGWGTLKWVKFVRERRSVYEKLKQKFIDKNKLDIKLADKIPADEQSAFKEFLERDGFLSYSSGRTIAPRIRDYADDFYNWVVFWPFSIFATFFNDILIKIFDYLKGMLQRISDQIFGSYKDDLNNDGV